MLYSFGRQNKQNHFLWETNLRSNKPKQGAKPAYSGAEQANYLFAKLHIF
jgi:hypothetical protein